MKLKVGIVSIAHLHVHSYVHQLKLHPDVELVGVWHGDKRPGRAFAKGASIPWFEKEADLLASCDAVVICSANNHHLSHCQAAARAGKSILCEKPVVARQADIEAIRALIQQHPVTFMTAFPCRFSPGYHSCKHRIAKGEIGKLKAIHATNRGVCPHSWFVEAELSGGGAMMDHVVHVGDLLRDLLGVRPVRVSAHIGNNMYGRTTDDIAMLTLDYPGGIFVTLDSSWSRPESFKTWGDVTMKFVGETGVIHLDMFAPSVGHFRNGPGKSYQALGFGSDLDGAMVAAFVESCRKGTPVPVSLEDGISAVEIALAGYRSAVSGQPEALV